MTTLLLCNVGMRDVLLADKHIDDETLRTNGKNARDQRQRAAYIRAHFSRVLPHIELSIIRKVIEYVGVDQIHQIVLFATDQADPRYRHTDTCDMAHIIRDVIIERWSIAPDAIRIEILHGDPANQNDTMKFYERVLPQLDAEFQPQIIYLEGTGGTPAMSMALQLAGTEVFQDRAVALYVAERSEMPNRLSVGKRVLGGALKKVLRANLTAFHYNAALETWNLYRLYFTDSAPESAATLVEGLLNHATERINLSVPAAREPLRGLERVWELYGSIPPLLLLLIVCMMEYWYGVSK